MCRRLRDARKRSGLKQIEAAAALGKPQNFVSKCETAQRRIDAIELADFAALYGTTLDALVPAAGRGTKSKRVAEPTIKPKQQAEAQRAGEAPSARTIRVVTAGRGIGSQRGPSSQHSPTRTHAT